MQSELKLNHAAADSISQKIYELLSHSGKFEDYVDYFFKQFKIDKLFEELGVSDKRRRFKSVDLLKHLIKITVSKQSIHEYHKDKTQKPEFSLKTVYRFLGREDINWLEFTTILSFAIFQSVYDPSLNLPVFFVFDDTDYKRPYSNYCQGISYQFDHNSKQMYKGYRLCMLSLYWNGFSIPISAVLVSTTDKAKMLFYDEPDNPSKAEGFRDRLLKIKANQVMLAQIQMAQTIGFNAQYLLFDSWYTFPRLVNELQTLGLNVIGMLKTNGNTKFRYKGSFYTIKELFEMLKSKGLPFQVEVDAVVREQNKEIFSFPVVLTFCQNKHKTRDYYCLLSSSTGVPEEEVISYFRYRWSIEQTFKDLKNPNLSLVSGSQTLSLTSISAYVSVVLIRYMVILTQREESKMSDEHSIQDQYRELAKECRTIDNANTDYKGIRTGIKRLSQYYNIDYDEMLRIFSSGAAEDEDFANKAEFLHSSITNLDSDID